MNRKYGILLTVSLMLTVLYAALFLSLESLPFQDLPNHLARAYVINQLFTRPHSVFSSYFTLELMFVPYILGDLLIACSLSVLSILQAGLFWNTLALFSFPAAVVFYLLSVGHPRLYILPCFFIVLYLSTSAFLLSGYLHFQLALAGSFAVFAYVELLADEQCDSGRKLLMWTGYWILICVCYLLHVSAFACLALLVAGLTLLRVWKHDYSVNHAFGVLLPLIFISSFQLSRGASKGQLMAAALLPRTLSQKFQAVAEMFVRYDYAFDATMSSAFAMLLIWGFLCSRTEGSRMSIRSARAREAFFLTALSIGILFLLPLEAGGAYVTENFTVPYIAVFLAIGIFREAADIAPLHPSISKKDSAARCGSRAAYWALILAGANLLYLKLYFGPLETRGRFLQEALYRIEPGKKLLPVDTTRPIGTIAPFAEIGALYTPLREGITPYLFSSTNGKPFPHFRYRIGLYTPYQSWYTRSKGVLDFERTALDFDYLFIPKPFEPARVGVAGLKPQVSTKTFALYKVGR